MMVGPFIFFDQMGPAHFRDGQGLDVRPHPHINLATVTYLFDGEIVHRDSLGTVQTIRPGDVNWMTAGRGIVHSERSPAAARTGNGTLFGIQLWVALPKPHEETEPTFHHTPGGALPVLEDGGVHLRVILGAVYGQRSPVQVHSELFYAAATLQPGARVPLPEGQEERAAYVSEGEVEVAGERYGEGQLLLFRQGDAAAVKALQKSRVLLLGGAAMDGPRHIWWNFVSSSRERIEQAKADWREGRMGKVPDETEFIPLPDNARVVSYP
jgi:redox-sensitive bicupin YhaK (pirin superfamily)